MRRFLLFFFAASLAHAAPVTSASCGLSGVFVYDPTSCSIPFVNNCVGGVIEAQVTITTPSPGTVNAEANGGATADPGVPWAEEATGSDTVYYATAGPERPGYIGLVESAFGGSSFVSVGPFSGYLTGMFQFELGTRFAGSVSVDASAGGPGAGPMGNESSAGYSFTLYEADGTTGVGFFVVAVPEPRSAALLLAGLALCAAVSRLRLRA